MDALGLSFRPRNSRCTTNTNSQSFSIYAIPRTSSMYLNTSTYDVGRLNTRVPILAQSLDKHMHRIDYPGVPSAPNPTNEAEDVSNAVP